MPRELSPESVQVWIRIGLSTILFFVGVGLLIWEAAFVPTPNALIVGAGLLAVGLPPAFRIDALLTPKRDPQ